MRTSRNSISPRRTLSGSKEASRGTGVIGSSPMVIAERSRVSALVREWSATDIVSSAQMAATIRRPTATSPGRRTDVQIRNRFTLPPEN
jgi:hypothetical protein